MSVSQDIKLIDDIDLPPPPYETINNNCFIIFMNDIKKLCLCWCYCIKCCDTNCNNCFNKCYIEKNIQDF